MQFLLPLIIGLVVGAIVGALLVLVLRGRRPVDDGVAASRIDELGSALTAAEVARASAEAAAKGLEAELGRLRADISSRDERERAQRAEEREVLRILAPVQESLTSVKQKVTELEQQRIQQYGSLAEQLRVANQNDEALRSTTESLASALRSNTVRGVWGETQLRRVVEAAGLLRYTDFDVQHSITTDAGRGRPDMVVHLPGGKQLAVDSKVPLDAFIEASQIADTATGEEGARRKTLMGQHVRALRSHIDALAKKTYWEGLESSPEFVIAFIPNEALLSSALDADPTLLEYAFRQQIALASPVNLWAVLKTIAFTWQQQAVTDEAKKLFDLGNQLYQRLSVMSTHAESLRKAIESTVDKYNKFASSLESRVLVTARQFPGIDEMRITQLPEAGVIHETPRHLTAIELTADESAEVEESAAAGLLSAIDAESPADEA